MIPTAKNHEKTESTEPGDTVVLYETAPGYYECGKGTVTAFTTIHQISFIYLINGRDEYNTGDDVVCQMNEALDDFYAKVETGIVTPRPPKKRFHRPVKRTGGRSNTRGHQRQRIAGIRSDLR